MPNPADDLLAEDPARDEPSLADMAALHRRFRLVSPALFSTRDQVLVLPKNALRLEASRLMQHAEQRRKKPSSLRCTADQDRAGRQMIGNMVSSVSHWRNSAIQFTDAEDASTSPTWMCVASHPGKICANFAADATSDTTGMDHARNAASLTCLRAALRKA
jgi:hypothetical protein